MIQASKLSAFKGKVCDQISLDAPSVTGLFLLKRKMRKFCVTRKQARAGERNNNCLVLCHSNHKKISISGSTRRKEMIQASK